MGQHALLISVAPVDGYPPVQAQASLLADNGYKVTVITMPLANSRSVAFAGRGVSIISVPGSGTGRAAGIRRLTHFVAAITRARRQLRPDVEIAYDPIGMLNSDLAMARPAFRIAHFHELLGTSTWTERRLKKSITSYQSVVLPDPDRARAIAALLDLAVDPLIVPNYPPLNQDIPEPREKPADTPFEVIYCGSLGRNQKLDLIIASIPLWPDNASLVLIGAENTPESRALKQQAYSAGLDDKIRFSGWMDLEALPARLVQADIGICLLDDTELQWRTALWASNKRFQYMQAGLPQIGDMNPGVADLLEGNGIGRSITEWSVEAIARIVTDYVADRPRVAREGLKAQHLHRSRFNYQSGAAPLLQLINTQAGKAP